MSSYHIDLIIDAIEIFVFFINKLPRRQIDSEKESASDWQNLFT